MQKEAQHILEQSPRLLLMQKWVCNKANKIPNFSQNNIRAMYWYLVFAVSYSQNPESDIILRMTLDLAGDISLLFEDNKQLHFNFMNPTQKLYFELSRDRTDLLDFAGSLLSPADKHIRGLTVSRTFESHGFLPNPLKSTIEYKYGLLFKKPVKKAETLTPLLLDMSVVNLLLFTTIFTYLSEVTVDELLTETRVKLFQSYLLSLEEPHYNHIFENQLPRCPSHDFHLRHEWHTFKENIQELSKILLGIDLISVWDPNETQIFTDYIRANLLIWECIKISPTEKNVLAEDLILSKP
jgi:hypothetical protein